MGECIPLILFLPPWIRPWPYATETIKRVWHISVTWQLAPFILFFFPERQSQKGVGGHGSMPPPLNTLLPRSLRLGACERIRSFKGG